MLLLIDKEHGWTSFDVCKKIRNIVDEKVGHAGTLDPYATGLMIIATGIDTKRIRHFTDMEKTYIATIDFSIETDTWDMEYRKYMHIGRVEKVSGTLGLYCQEEFIIAPTLDSVEKEMNTIIGTPLLPLTPFSAKKWKGKKLYEYARKGNPIFIDMPMDVLSYTILDYQFPELRIEIRVGSGTYIRSVAYWLGKQFGLGGTLTSLRRTQVGEYSIADACMIDDIHPQ